MDFALRLFIAVLFRPFSLESAEVQLFRQRIVFAHVLRIYTCTDFSQAESVVVVKATSGFGVDIAIRYTFGVGFVLLDVDELSFVI